MVIVIYRRNIIIGFYVSVIIDINNTIVGLFSYIIVGQVASRTHIRLSSSNAFIELITLTPFVTFIFVHIERMLTYLIYIYIIVLHNNIHTLPPLQLV